MPHTDFLSLPPELRNTIYQIVADTTTTVRLTVGGGTADHPLTSVCQQLRQEFTPVWRHKDSATIEIIQATVINYDFSQVKRAMKPFDAAYTRWYYSVYGGDGKAKKEDEEEEQWHGPGPKPPYPTPEITLRFSAPFQDPVQLSRSLDDWIRYLVRFHRVPGAKMPRYRAEFDWEVYDQSWVMQLVDDSDVCYYESEVTVELEAMQEIQGAALKALREREDERSAGTCGPELRGVEATSRL
ncbi:hypothetical protein LTR85_001384 [Meristemomyces frigidus]|nr:hypothetical protein LTR85_001384 [Meristemomyces frigidus]